MDEEGWFSYHEQDADGTGHTLIITDDTYSLPALHPQAIQFHRAGTGDEVEKIVQWSGTRTLSSSQLTTQTFNYKDPGYPHEKNVKIFPEHGASTTSALEVYEYTGAYTHSDNQQGERQLRHRMEAWESHTTRFFGVAGTRNLRAGSWFSLENHPAHLEDSKEEREFIVIAVDWLIENNLPLSATCKDFPGSLKGELNAMKERIGVGLQANSERTGLCFNRFEAQRRKVPFRSLREHQKPVMHAQTAIVVGLAKQEIYTDNLNRIKIKFHWDRINPGNDMVDHAGLPGLAARLTESGAQWVSLFDSQDPDILSVAPLLVRIDTGQNGIAQRRVVRWAVEHGTYASCLLLMASPLALHQLAPRLMARLEAVLPENMDILLRFHDPRVFEQLMMVLSAAQKQAFLGAAHHWWFVDRRGQLQDVAAKFDQKDAFLAPLTLSGMQESALLDASEPDQVAQLLQSGAPNDYQTLRPAERYDFIVRHMASARGFGVQATHELSLYCLLALLYGEQFASQKNWQAALQDVHEKKMSLTQAAAQVELNDSITG